MPPWITAFVNWIGKFNPRYAVVLLILTALLLFVSTHTLAFFGVALFALNYRGYIALMFGFCLFLTATYPVERAWKLLSAVFERHKATKGLERSFESLGTDQIAILVQYVESGKNSIHFSPANGAVQDLVSRGILYTPQQWMNASGQFAYSLTSPASGFLDYGKFQEMLQRRTKKEAKGTQIRLSKPQT
jgi:Super-infection exclusion protein B